VSVCPPIVTVPLRAAPGFTAAETATDPPPAPDVPDVTVIHAAFDTAVHVQPAPALTLVEALPPALLKSRTGGFSPKLQGAAACDTVNVWPAIVAVPVRAAPVFAAIVKRTGPDPFPDAPAAIEIHEAFAADAHAHEPPLVTVTVTVVASAGTAWLAGAIE
jgi:hypothetical protein